MNVFLSCYLTTSTTRKEKTGPKKNLETMDNWSLISEAEHEYNKQNFARTLELCVLVADTDITGCAWYRIGILYLLGEGVEKNRCIATECFTKALPLLLQQPTTNTLAMCNLGYMYNEGLVVEKDKSRAMEYYTSVRSS